MACSKYERDFLCRLLKSLRHQKEIHGIFTEIKKQTQGFEKDRDRYINFKKYTGNKTNHAAIGILLANSCDINSKQATQKQSELFLFSNWKQ